MTDARLLITKRQAAAALAISKRTLDRLIAGGTFPPPLKIGRAARITRADLDAYVGNLQQKRLNQEPCGSTRP